MAELDIDKMLEAREKKEEGRQKKHKSAMTAILVAAGAVVLAGIIAVSMLFVGENSDEYLPFDPGKKVSLNLTGGNPEQWQFLEKPENFAGYSCYVLNMTDMGDNTSRQEYYTETDDGIMKVGTSENFNEKKKYLMIVLPPKIKLNKPFIVAKVSGGEMTGVISQKEKQKFTTGVTQVIRVDYKGGNYLDKSVWYAKGIGIIRSEDRKSGRVYNLFNIE